MLDDPTGGPNTHEAMALGARVKRIQGTQGAGLSVREEERNEA